MSAPLSPRLRDRAQPTLDIAHVIASIETQASGPSYSVLRLAQSLSENFTDDQVRLMALGPAGQTMDGRLRLLRFPGDGPPLPGWQRLSGSSSMRRALLDAAPALDIVHGHGLWLLPNIYTGSAARAGSARLVISPRGMLAPSALAYSRHLKRAMWALLQGRTVQGAHAFHATSEQEYHDIRAFGLEQPVAVIPIGIDVPAEAKLKSATKQHEILFLGRLHPIKGIEYLLRAWAMQAPQFPAWSLRIVGPGDPSYVSKLKGIVAGLPRVTMQEGLYGDDKAAAMARASLLVLPSFGENFAIVVAEALSLGTPVIASRGTPWSGLVANECGWWVGHEPPSLAAALDEALRMPLNALAAMGLRGRAWMQRDFEWTSIAAVTRGLYAWLRFGGPAPACVRLT